MTPIIIPILVPSGGGPRWNPPRWFMILYLTVIISLIIFVIIGLVAMLLDMNGHPAFADWLFDPILSLLDRI